MKRLNLLLLFFLINNFSHSQTNEMAKKVVTLINEARTNPKHFFNTYQSKIEAYNPYYAKSIQTEKPIDAVIWDEGLVQMAKSTIEKKDLNPSYTGKNSLCGYSSGKTFGTLSSDPLEYICDIYTNIHDDDYKYLGLYFNQTNSGYSFQWGISCDRKKITFDYTESIDSSNVDFKKLDTGINANYMSEVEKKMLLEINYVRAYPKIYAKLIKKYLADESNSWRGLKKDTYEAGMQLIEELDNLTPLSILAPSACIYKAAKLHGQDCMKRGFFSHTGSDRSNPWDRITKQCPEYKTGNENGAGNASENPRVPIISLLLDDGISTRGHRYNILDKNWEYGACYRYSDKQYGYYWVQNFGY